MSSLKVTLGFKKQISGFKIFLRANILVEILKNSNVAKVKVNLKKCWNLEMLIF